MALLTDDDFDEDDNRGVPFSAVMAAAWEATADIAVIADASQTVTYISASFTAMTGYTPDEMIGRNCRVLQGPGTDPATARQMRDVLASGGVFEGEILNYRRNGAAFWTSLKIVPMRLGAGSEITHHVSVQHDISNRVALVNQLQTQALRDHVTGLPNRSAAERAVDEAVQHYPRDGLTVAVCLIDLDDFRQVNNTFGHAAGDAVLRQWAVRVLSHLREGDVLARMGGDEFLLILGNINPETSETDLPSILERVHRAVEEPFTVDSHQVSIGMSLGLAIVSSCVDSQRILRDADEALYAAKRRASGELKWWHFADHTSLEIVEAQSAARFDIGNAGPGKTGLGGPAPDIYVEALRAGNIVIHLQPVLNLRDGSTSLFEALARLKLPDGMISYPDDFLPHLGPDDLRVLFDGVLDQSLKVLAAWDREGSSQRMAINLPPEILHDRSLPTLIEDKLRMHNIAPTRLGLELLESQVIDLEDQRLALQDLVGLGVGLAMDDLGSGYSSLHRLSSFPFSAVKLDRGLLFHIYDRPVETLSMMATLIQLGRDLGVDVVVEGLEDQSLTEAATILGAPYGQGYHFAKPMAPEDCIPWSESLDRHSFQSPFKTPMGALAYHWQFARLGAPHPLAVSQCPLTRFIAGTDPDPEVESWHVLQHTPQGAHSPDTRFLINWLTQRINTHDS